MSAEVIDKAPYWARRITLKEEEDGFEWGGTIISVCFGKWKRDRGNKQTKKCLYKQHGRECMIVVCVTR